jgi:hypothetical protein
MPVTQYTYTLPADVPQGVAVGNLTSEINAAGSGITTQIDHIDASPTQLDIYMKDALSAGEKTALDGDTTAPAGGLLAAHDPTLVNDPQEVILSDITKTGTGHAKVEVQPREGVGVNFHSPNLCDRTTWHEGATAVTEFELSSGDDTVWNTNGTHDGPWIDLVHGKLFGEDNVSAATPSLLCTVEVSTDGGTTWDPKTENSIGSTSDGDYSVNYTTGVVTFNSALTPGDKVRASFSKAPATMLLTIAPESGKKVRIVYVETQLSVDCQFTETVTYEVWAYDPNDLPNKMLVKKSSYKTINDFLYESTGVYNAFPAIDTAGPRGLAQDVIVVPFNYTTSRDLLASQGLEIRMKLSKEFAGLLCTSTFYCLQEDE